MPFAELSKIAGKIKAKKQKVKGMANLNYLNTSNKRPSIKRPSTKRPFSVILTPLINTPFRSPRRLW